MLNVNYVPSADSTPISAQFSAAVSLSDGAALSVHTLQVDSTCTFTINEGNLTANKISLMPHASAPAKLLLNGDLAFTPLANAAAVIGNGSGSGLAGRVDLGGAARTIDVADGSPANDLTISVPVINGGLTKTGAGTLVLSGANTYAGDTVLEQGSLSLATSFLANAADVKLLTGASRGLNFAGIDVIDSLFIDGLSQAVGTWGAVGSAADFTSPLITGSGLLQVSTFIPPPSPADFNLDGYVDAADLLVWQTNLGKAGDATNADGDANGDLNVDGGDFLVWQQQFTGAPPASAVVPEPTGAVLLLMATTVAMLGRRARAH
jgi:autotransporter-associated beta strand protein